MLKKLSKEDYYKFVGLFALASHHVKALKEIEIAAAEIIEMPPDEICGDDAYYGHLSDAIYGGVIGGSTPDATLRRLEIVVINKAKK